MRMTQDLETGPKYAKFFTQGIEEILRKHGDSLHYIKECWEGQRSNLFLSFGRNRTRNNSNKFQEDRLR